MPKTKQPFVYFCLEKQQMDRSLKGKSLKELAAVCSEEWQSMSHGQKQGYIATADEMSSGKARFEGVACLKQGMAGRFDNMGQSLLAKDLKQLEQKNAKYVMQKDIEHRVRYCTATKLRFHLMAVNTWMRDSVTGQYIPAEIAILEMTLSGGISEKYVELVSPGYTPTRYRAELKTNSDKFHSIWLDNPDLSVGYERTLQKIEDIVRVRGDERPAGFHGIRGDFESTRLPESFTFARERQLLPIYVLADDRDVVERSLAWMSDQSGPEIRSNFVLYNLDFLFFVLLNSAPSLPPSRMSLTMAECHLKRDVFLYEPSMSCKYHRSIDSCHCAGAKICRFAYIICDFCCQYYGIRPIEGQHVPRGVDTSSMLLAEECSGGDANTSLGSGKSSSIGLEFAQDPSELRQLKLESLPVTGFLQTAQALDDPLAEFLRPGGTSKTIDEVIGALKPVELPVDLSHLEENLTVDLSYADSFNASAISVPLPLLGGFYDNDVVSDDESLHNSSFRTANSTFDNATRIR